MAREQGRGSRTAPTEKVSPVGARLGARSGPRFENRSYLSVAASDLVDAGAVFFGKGGVVFAADRADLDLDRRVIRQ